MRLIVLAVTAVFLAMVAVSAAPAAPSGVGSYIVVLKDSANPAAVASDHGRRYGSTSSSSIRPR